MKQTTLLYESSRQHLSETDLFKRLPRGVLDDMLSHFRLETWKKGVVLDSQKAMRRFYVIVKGRMKLNQALRNNGKLITLHVLQKGDVFDVLNLLDRQEYIIAPEALDDIHLLSAPVDQARLWIKQYPEFDENVTLYLEKHINIKGALIADLSFHENLLSPTSSTS